MFTFFEWHTQHLKSNSLTISNCFRTICLLFLNDIHNLVSHNNLWWMIVLGLYVYFFWMTYTTDFLDEFNIKYCFRTICLLFLNDIHNLFGNNKYSCVYCFRTICLLFLNDIHNREACFNRYTLIVLGLYVYFFWMTYTTNAWRSSTSRQLF